MIQSLYRIRTEESGDYYYVIANDKDAAEEIFAKEMGIFPEREQTTYAGRCITTEDEQAKKMRSALEGIINNILTQPVVLEEFSRHLRAFEENSEAK